MNEEITSNASIRVWMIHSGANGSEWVFLKWTGPLWIYCHFLNKNVSYRCRMSWWISGKHEKNWSTDPSRGERWTLNRTAGNRWRSWVFPADEAIALNHFGRLCMEPTAGVHLRPSFVMATFHSLTITQPPIKSNDLPFCTGQPLCDHVLIPFDCSFHAVPYFFCDQLDLSHSFTVNMPWRWQTEMALQRISLALIGSKFHWISYN